MTLRELAVNHPEWLDHTIVVYTDQGYDYVANGFDRSLPNSRGAVYEGEQMVDVPGQDCQPSGVKLLVFSGN